MKIFDLITQDVREKNESKKVMVSLRILYLIVLVAFVLDVIFAGFGNFMMNSVGVSLFFVCLICLFCITYRSKTQTSVWLFVIYILAWTVYSIPRVGWTAGMQNYFLLALTMVFYGLSVSLRTKIIYSVIVLTARIVLIMTYGGVKPALEISWLADKILQSINITAVFASILFLAYTFSKDEKEAEGKLVKYNDQLQKEAHTDQLTGLYNRRRAKEYLADLVEDDSHTSVSLAMGDIDFFKKVNDTYGHDAGDEVLKTIARMMTTSLRATTFVSRWGGEEFLIIFPDCNGDEAHIALERLRRTIKDTPIIVGDLSISITMTFGLAEYDYSGDFEKSIKEADEKLYQGKAGGRNQVVY